MLFLLVSLLALVSATVPEDVWLSSATTDPEIQIQAVKGLINRLVPFHSQYFSLSIIPSENGFDVFEVETVNGIVELRGSTGVALASGLNWYLKYKCYTQFTWQDSQMNLPAVLPEVNPVYRQVTPYEFRYYYNVCTFGYSSPFWSWSRWEKDIDWMALNSVNFPLAFVGQEFVWLQTFAALGLNSTQVSEEWFSGAAFLAWNRMGNINNWGGSLPQNYLMGTVELQRQILQRQRAFGMKPILPGFAGHVPPVFSKFFPNANVTKLTWSPEYGETYLLAAEDPLYETIGNLFIKIQTQIFGTDHYYNADPFNEMTPASNSSEYLASVSKAIYAAMTQSDPEAVWILQGWFLIHSEKFWQPTQTKAFLDAVPDDKLIVLDLWAEIFPYWKDHDNFYGKKYIWCMLHNFGGRSGLYAAFDRVNEGVIDSLKNAPNMVGIGLTPEAIESNPIIYDFMMEFAWTDKVIDLESWIEGWSHRRYGVHHPAAVEYWQILRKDILNCPTEQMGATAPSYISRPNITVPEIIGCCAPTKQYYAVRPLIDAWKSLLSASDDLGHLETYQNDLVEITRQLLGEASELFIQDAILMYNRSDVEAFDIATETFLELVNDVDRILATQKNYLLGGWVNEAAQWGTNPTEVATMTHGALLQITLWGPASFENGLNEYAYKLWSGLVAGYYGQRWELFLKFLRRSIDRPHAYDPAEFHSTIFKFEWDFTLNSTLPTTEPSGENTVELSKQMLAKWKLPLETLH